MRNPQKGMPHLLTRKGRLQIFNGSPLQTNIEAQISTMAYFDLILRTVTDPGLLSIFIKFLLDEEKFDGQRIIDILVERINSTDTRVMKFFIEIFKKKILLTYCHLCL